jgi:hypothetical protein
MMAIREPAAGFQVLTSAADFSIHLSGSLLLELFDPGAKPGANFSLEL